MIKIRVAIVDDHHVVRAGLRGLLEDETDIEVVAEAIDGLAVLDLLRKHELDVLILDLSMPQHDGFEAVARVHERAPDVGILVLSSYPESQYAVSLLRRGASGYLNKGCDPREIITAIRRIADGHRYITANVAELLATQLSRGDSPAHEELSKREMQVFLRLARGETVGAIAASLFLSVKTVSTYRTRVLEKLALGSNSELTYYAMKHRLIE